MNKKLVIAGLISFIAFNLLSDDYFTLRAGERRARSRVSILEEGTNRWDGAYNWGDHSTKGYATTGEVDLAVGTVITGLNNHTNDGSIHLTTEQVIKIGEAVSTQKLEQVIGEIDFTERDPAYWREYYYGDPNIYPSPTNWFLFRCNEQGEYLIFAFSDEFPGNVPVVVPYELYGNVVHVFPSLLTYNSEIRSFTAGVETVAPGFAQFCENLREVTLIRCISVGYAAFWHCYSLTNITFGSTAPIFTGVDHFKETPETLTITVTDPQATGYGDWIGDPPRRVVRPVLHTDKLVLGGKEVTEIPEVATTNIAPYKAWTGIIPIVDGTATLHYAHGNMPVLTLDGENVFKIADDEEYGESGESRVSLTIYRNLETHSLTIPEGVVVFDTPADLSTNMPNKVLLRKIGSDSWRGVQLK